MKSQHIQSSVSTKPETFRHVLQVELARRCSTNPRYSLRAFAKYLGLDHSTLSQVIRGKRQITPTQLRKAGARLGYSSFEIETWLHLESCKPATNEVTQELRQLSDDIASVINDINHYAILELTRLENFQADSRWIARMLEITVDEVNIAVQCLLRLQLLEMVSPTHWVDRLGDAMFSVSTITQSSIERFHQQLQQLMLRSMTTKATHSSLTHSTTLAISSKRIPLAQDLLNAFQREFVATMSQGDPHDAVYLFHLSFLLLTPSNGA